MTTLIRKLSSYNILNNLLPGILFIFFWDRMFPQAQFALNKEAYIENAFIYYFFGMVISRIGSTIIEEIYKKIKFIKYSEYTDYVNAEKLDSKLSILVETNNLYRTSTAIFFTLCIAKTVLIIYNNSICSALEQIFDDSLLMAMLSLFILFSFSFRKQTNYITQRVYSVLQQAPTSPESR